MAAGIWLRDKPLMDMLKRWTTECPGGSKVHKNKHLRNYRKWILKDIGKRFRKRGVDENDRTGVWPDLDIDYAKYKAYSGRPMMIKTGNLAHSIKIKVKKSGAQIFQTAGTSYYWAHHHGDKVKGRMPRRRKGNIVTWTPYQFTMPQRQILLWTQGNCDKLGEELEKWFMKIAND